jgi:signal transduction histidine kinase
MQKRTNPTKQRILRIVLYACLGLVALSSLTLFIYFNNRSRDAVQAERGDYTAEIAAQMTRNLNNLQDSYSKEIAEGANVLSVVQPTTQSQLASLYPDRDSAKHFLITGQSEFFSIDGQEHTLGDVYFATNLYKSSQGQVLLSHSLIDASEVYLLFGEAIKPITIESHTYTALVLGVTAEEFSKNMSISIFKGAGAGYLITADGVIFLRPDSGGLIPAGSYNFFSALEKGGVEKTDTAALAKRMLSGSAETILNVDGTQWMIEIQKTQFDEDYIVVAVPLTLTAAQTYNNMTLTVVFAFIFIIALAGIMLILMFSTLLRQREEDRKAAAVEAQTTFLAKMSHDIRTPLNAVNGMLQLASDPRHSRQEVDEFVGKASESANYLLELINGMLDLQKINSGKMNVAHEPFSMETLLSTITSMYRPVVESKGLQFFLKGENDFSSDYYGDETKIKEILMNLLSNAMKFTSKGGSVSLITHVKPLDPSHETVILEVADTGIGMSEEFQAQMFTPFTQEKTSASSTYVGTGLGLSIVKSLSELLGGKVEVESTLGKGSTFRVSLPLEKTGSVLPKKAVGKTLLPFAGQKVLLAEDNVLNQQIAILLLKERLSLEVVATANGQEALTAFTTSKPGYFSAILMDVRMPVMNGIEAAKAIRASAHPDAKNIPIIALSTNTYAEDVAQSLAAGMNAHLAKPIDLAELADTLHRYID